MCTLSWQVIPENETLHVFFNRDELFSRPEAEPPNVLQDDDDRARFLAPVDPQGGGTWIAANEHGLIICLLNDYQGRSVENLTDKAKSRGLLVRKLAGFDSVASVKACLTEKRLKIFQPFNLVLFDRISEPVMWHWDGEKLRYEANPALPVVSSGFDQPMVRRKRAEVFSRARNADGLLTPEAMLNVHRSAEPQPQPLSVAMQLPDKGTVSITQIEMKMKLDAKKAGKFPHIMMRYWPGKPLEVEPEPGEIEF
ncbi:MAG: NRDE family protein [Balneolales bacterium]|nr:NRDE family protein [Balneolales bacterium]